VKVIAFFGRKNSGKTTIVCKLLKSLRGKSVLVFKHISKPDFEIDREGTDTWKFFNSGARMVVGSSTNKLAIIARSNDIINPLGALRALKMLGFDFEYVLIEGFHNLLGKNEKIYKVILTKNIPDLQELYNECARERLVAIVLNGISKDKIEPFISNIPIYDISEIDELANMIKKLEDNL